MAFNNSRDLAEVRRRCEENVHPPSESEDSSDSIMLQYVLVHNIKAEFDDLLAKQQELLHELESKNKVLIGFSGFEMLKMVTEVRKKPLKKKVNKMKNMLKVTIKNRHDGTWTSKRKALHSNKMREYWARIKAQKST